MKALVLGMILNGMLGLWAIAQEEPCRMLPDALQPLIPWGNPFFTAHTWDNTRKRETASMGPHRFVTLEQHACLRHHIILTLAIAPAEAKPTEPGFYAEELFVLLTRLWGTDPSYCTYNHEFEAEVLRQMNKSGIGRTINFPIAERSFILRFFNAEEGAAVQLEVVRLLHAQPIKLPGIAADADDGWQHLSNNQ